MGDSTEYNLQFEKIKSEEEDSHITLPDYQILSYPADFTVEVLNNKMVSGDIEVRPYQRRYIWKQYQATRLIESFLVGLPVPPIFLYTDPVTEKFNVIDGQQRLRTIQYFIEGHFGSEQKGKATIFRLKELSEKSRWYNKTYQELSGEDKRKLLNCVLRAIIVKQLDPKNDTSIYHIFERLNTGGTLLTNEEIRNSIYNGKFNDLLKKLNKNENWKLLIGKPLDDSRQKDIELILRFISLYYNGQNYEKPLKDFMTIFMSKNRNPSDDFLSEIETIFNTTCEKIYTHLGGKPFKIKSGLNPAALDSIMVSFAKNLNDIPSDIKERYQNLVANDTYKLLIRNATTDETTMNNRMNLADEILFH
ncbi:MAG TPA: DUF262 domain-containing protein [Bacteroidetes bacterium]|nr:DUF262 domain-containing protein [Bacteroidota bacterium]